MAARDSFRRTTFVAGDGAAALRHIWRVVCGDAVAQPEKRLPRSETAVALAGSRLLRLPEFRGVRPAAATSRCDPQHILRSVHGGSEWVRSFRARAKFAEYRR